MAEGSSDYPYPLSYKDHVYNLRAKRPQFLHTMLCVKDLEASRAFYVDGLGMTLFDRMDVDFAPRTSALFVGFDKDEGVLEITHYWDNDGPYGQRPGFGHIALGVPRLDPVMDKLEALGVTVVKPKCVLLPGAPAAAFVLDPDGYEVELIQTDNEPV